MKASNPEIDTSQGSGANRSPRQIFKKVAIALGAVIFSTAPSLPEPEHVDNTDKVLQVGTPFKVGTANVHSWRKTNNSSGLDGFKQFITTEKPDILCGTEGLLGDKFPSDFFEKKRYSTVTAPARLVPFVDSSAYGPFLASNYEIVSHEVHDLPQEFDLWGVKSKIRQRNFIYARIAMSDGDSLGVICSHLDIKDSDNARQTQAILDFASDHKEEGPIVWLGDANNGSLFAVIEGASPPPSRSPDLFTFPAHAPMFSPDHARLLYASDSAKVTQYETFNSGFDHLALVATVEL